MIEPTGALLDAVAQAKELVHAKAAGRQYLGEPPHCTVLAGDFTSVGALEKAVAAIAGELSPFEIRTDRLIEIEGDPLAEGRTTFALGTETSNGLSSLQRRLAASVRDIALGDDTSSFTDNRWSESARDFGWPFVGDHWIPHFTVAALDAAADAAIASALRARKYNFAMTASSVCVWDVSGPRPIRTSVIPFRGR